MLFTFLRNLFLFFNCIVVFHKLLRPKPKSLVYKVLEFILPAVLAGLPFFLANIIQQVTFSFCP